MNDRYLPLTFKPEPMPASGSRNCSKSIFRHGPLLLAIFAGASLLPVAGAQAAEPRVTTLSATVPFGDLNLVRPADQRTLDSRTARTAHTLCRKLNPGRNERMWCTQDAILRTAPQKRQAIAQHSARQMAAAAP
jgi:UrcA family protein